MFGHGRTPLPPYMRLALIVTWESHESRPNAVIVIRESANSPTRVIVIHMKIYMHRLVQYWHSCVCFNCTCTMYIILSQLKFTISVTRMLKFTKSKEYKTQLFLHKYTYSYTIQNRANSHTLKFCNG